MTTAEGLMQAVLARLDGSPPLAGNIRRGHRVRVAREDAPAIYLVDGKDEIVGGDSNDCRRNRRKHFQIRIFVRDDAGATAADDMVDDVNERLNPMTAYGNAVTLHQGDIAPDEEIADGDAIRIDMDFYFDYVTGGWAL